MDYSPEEMAFVEFCESQGEDVICVAGGRGRRRVECPAQKDCDDNNPRCSQILVDMQEKRELTQEQVQIIRFWLRDIQWDEENCIPAGGTPKCDNYDSEACAYDQVCEQLLRKLGVHDPDQYEIYEEEIQKVIVEDLLRSRLDWHLGEQLEYHVQKPPTAVGRPDILCIGAQSKTLYVVELKAVQAQRSDVGQLASYVGWYRAHPEHRPVPCRDTGVVGILLATDFSARSEYALRACTRLYGRRFHLHAEIVEPVEQPV